MEKGKILIVEDEPDIANLIGLNLEIENFKPLYALDGLEGYEKAEREQPLLIILDLMLPKMGGLEVCKKLKQNSKTKHIPILMLTAKGEEVDKVVGFELGADDYVVKPFSVRELILRIKAILRRYADKQEITEVWTYKDMSLDLKAMTLIIQNKEINLTSTEFKLLKEFIQNKNTVLSREYLLDKVWGYEFDGYARTVDTHIRRLRVKLGAYSSIIETVRGAGYRLRIKDE